MSNTINVDRTVPRRLLQACDRDITEVFGFFTDETKFQMANSKVAVGQEEIIEFLCDHLSAVAGLKHEILDEYYNEDTAALRVTGTYLMKDGSSVSLPGMIWIRLHEDKVAEYYLFFDPAPLAGHHQA